MMIGAGLLKSQTRLWTIKSYLRIIPMEYESTPLGVGPGNSRFSSLGNTFAVLYAARDLSTALAETVIRDRFEGAVVRQVFIDELKDRSIVELSATKPLQLVDLRDGGCLKLGVSTDVMGAKGFKESQVFSQFIHDNSDSDGILYASRLTGQPCAAIFDRAIATHLFPKLAVPLTQIKRLALALDSLNVELLA